MTKEQEYRNAVTSIAMAAKMISIVDVPGMLQAIEKAEAIGPIVDPTLYRAKAKAMAEDAELLRAALPLWKKAQRFAEVDE